MSSTDRLVKTVIVTRGRTGSTAIVDELGKIDHSFSMQEIFTASRPEKHSFNEWKMKYIWRRFLAERRLADVYLNAIENKALKEGYRGFFWKLLSHQFNQRPYLCDLIKRHGYKAIYLKRNLARQVLSGMVAKERNVHNSREKIEDRNKYFIDISEFTRAVSQKRTSIKRDHDFLSRNKIDFIVVSYEAFLADRCKFYRSIFEFLELPVGTPDNTNYVVMIDDLRLTIDNYDQVHDLVVEWGETL